MRARQSSSAWAGSWPSTLTSPADRIRNPSRISIVVVLPAPFGPSRQTTWPRGDVEVHPGQHVVVPVAHPQVADPHHRFHGPSRAPADTGPKQSRSPRRQPPEAPAQDGRGELLWLGLAHIREREGVIVAAGPAHSASTPASPPRRPDPAAPPTQASEGGTTQLHFHRRCSSPVMKAVVVLHRARDNRRVGAESVPTYCPLCVSRCGARAEVSDGTFLALHPDPSHPTGKAICLKGKAAPDIVYHPSRLLHPMRRTRPKDAADPGWERLTWDEALDAVASRLRTAAATEGPESVGFSSSSPSTSAISDAVDWVQRLVRAFGSPNYCNYMELCGWGRYLAPLYTFGASVPGVYLPDLENAGCILFWGYNPSVARLAHATSTVAAVGRGAKLIVVDPRKVGLAAKADHWLRVRPGTDAALALSLTHVMIENGWYDAAFVRDWTNADDVVDGETVWNLLSGALC